jgi:hypothetical protein
MSHISTHIYFGMGIDNMTDGRCNIVRRVSFALFLIAVLVSGINLISGSLLLNHSAPNTSGGVVVFGHSGTMVPANISAGMFGHSGTMVPANISAGMFGHSGTPVPGGVSSASSSVDWAIGGYSTSTGKTVESTTWNNLPSSPSLTGVNFVAFMVNTPFGANGSLTSGSNKYKITGILFQGAVYYSASMSYACPDMTVVFLVSLGGSTYTALNASIWTGINLGSGKITDSISFTTYNGVTGWWWYITTSGGTYYIMAVTPSGFYYASSPSGGGESPSGFKFLLSMVNSTSTQQSGGGNTFDPSVAMEVNEASSGNFLSDNPNFVAEANVAGGRFYYLGLPSLADFDIGVNSPPSTAYASGGKGGGNYLDEFGTKTGIQNWMSSEYHISNAAVTQTARTDLPSLNYPLNFYLTMKAASSGNPYGKGSVSPSSGWYQAGSNVTITATPASGCNSFKYWAGSGTISYTGNNNPAFVIMDSNITEIGYFINACTVSSSQPA